MAQDVVAAVRTLRPVPEVALLAEDPLSARRLAGRRGLVVEAAPGAGLNLHLACAIAVLGAHRPGATALVLAADIPQVQPREIVRLLRAASEHDLVVVPDRHGRGANALAFQLDRPPAFAFGADSCLAASRQCRARRPHGAGAGTRLVRARCRYARGPRPAAPEAGRAAHPGVPGRKRRADDDRRTTTSARRRNSRRIRVRTGRATPAARPGRAGRAGLIDRPRAGSRQRDAAAAPSRARS